MKLKFVANCWRYVCGAFNWNYIFSEIFLGVNRLVFCFVIQNFRKHIAIESHKSSASSSKVFSAKNNGVSFEASVKHVSYPRSVGKINWLSGKSNNWTSVLSIAQWIALSFPVMKTIKILIWVYSIFISDKCYCILEIIISSFAYIVQTLFSLCLRSFYMRIVKLCNKKSSHAGKCGLARCNFAMCVRPGGKTGWHPSLRSDVLHEQLPDFSYAHNHLAMHLRRALFLERKQLTRLRRILTAELWIQYVLNRRCMLRCFDSKYTMRDYF